MVWRLISYEFTVRGTSDHDSEKATTDGLPISLMATPVSERVVLKSGGEKMTRVQEVLWFDKSFYGSISHTH